jgi:hypothetical protein
MCVGMEIGKFGNQAYWRPRKNFQESFSSYFALTTLWSEILMPFLVRIV